MNRFFEKLRLFMSGRNGFDRLSFICFLLYTALVFVNIFTRSYIVYIIELLILGYIIFRVLSRNVMRRHRENMFFVKLTNRIGAFFVRQKNKLRDIKTHRYIKCKSCKAFLRVKRKKGKHSVRCPKCSKVFEVNIRI